MARDVRQLRAEAAEAASAGKHKRALAAYLALEQLEPRDAQWSKRAAETYRRLGREKEALSAFARAADRYAQGGFLVQAIAVCKLILQIDPKNDDALRRIAAMNEQIGAGPTRAVAMAEANPNLAQNAAVAALRSRGNTGAHVPPTDANRPHTETTAPPIAVARTRTPNGIALPRTRTPQQLARMMPHDVAAANHQANSHDGGARTKPGSTPPLSIARTKSKPITLPPDQPLDTISFKDEVPDAFERSERSGVYVIPIDEPGAEDLVEIEAEGSSDYAMAHDWPADGEDVPASDSAPMIEIEDPARALPDAIEVDDTLDADDALDEIAEVELEDLEEIPLAEPRLLASAAADALARTPLFAGLSRDALEALVQRLTLVHLGVDEILFREGDPGDALYVIVEGEVAVQAEGPPRVEMARLGAGAFIGEVALMTDQPRSATICSITDTELLRIDRTTLSGVLATHGEVLAAVLRFVRDRLVDRWTRTSPLFRPFDENERAHIASRFRFLEIESGTLLFSAGAKPDGLYIVLAGKFSVQRDGAQLGIVGPGELIGETALISGAPFKSDVVARGKCLALCLPAGKFRELIMTHPHVLEYIGEAAEQSRRLSIL